MKLFNRALSVYVGALLIVNYAAANEFAPTAPANVVAQRTSDSTVNITWSPSTDDVRVLGYNVYRDDRYISTVTNPRLNDIQLAANVVYNYYIVAFDAQRNFSPRSVVGSTNGTSATPSTSPAIPVSGPASSGVFINSGNALERWADVVAVLNEERVNAFFESLEQELNFDGPKNGNVENVNGIDFSFSTLINPPYQFVEDEGEVFDQANQDLFTCVGGGQVLGYDSTVFTGYDRVFENCAVGENEYRGTAGARRLLRGAIAHFPYVDFQRLGSNGRTSSIDGVHFAGNSSFVLTDRKDGWQDLSYTDSFDDYTLNNYSVERSTFDSSGNFFGETVTVDGNTINVVNYVVRRTINGQFAVNAPFTNGETLAVSIDLRFEDTATEGADNPAIEYPGRDTELPFEWQTGQVNIIASDGSAMTVRPQAGNQFVIDLGTGEQIGPLPWTGEFTLQ